jgi:hypothetical protein
MFDYIDKIKEKAIHIFFQKKQVTMSKSGLVCILIYLKYQKKKKCPFIGSDFLF